MRTVKDFVKQLFEAGRSPKHIRAVAACSRWKNNMDEVKILPLRVRKQAN